MGRSALAHLANSVLSQRSFSWRSLVLSVNRWISSFPLTSLRKAEAPSHCSVPRGGSFFR